MSPDEMLRDVFTFEKQVELTNALELLMDVQHVVSSNVDGCITDKPPTPDQVLTYTMATVVELIELMSEMNWKPWKPAKPVDRTKIALEFADVLAFIGVLLNYMNEYGVKPIDLSSAYRHKTNVNIDRLTGKVEEYRRLINKEVVHD